VVKLSVNDRDIYVEEIIYEKGLTNEDLAFLMKEKGISRDNDVVCDSAEPKSITELNRNGLQVVGVKKGSGSILYGIQKIKTFNIYIHEDSENLIREWNNYKFKKDRSGNLTKTPIGDDHLLDALRYGVLQFLDNQYKKGKYVIIV
jgi:phage terminase large subunit